MVMLVWGDCDQIPADDRGLAYGDGLFETIRVSHHTPTLRQRHVDRLLAGTACLRIPLSASDLESAVDASLAHFRRDSDWVLKLILTRGSGGRGYTPSARPRPRLIASAHDMPPTPDTSGVVACLSAWNAHVPGPLAGLKSLNRLPQVMASAEMPAGCYEAIMCDDSGRMLEGTRANLFLRLGDQWLTPPGSHLAVAGVMRAEVMARLAQQGEPVLERPLPPALLEHPDCRALVLVNSVVGAVPVRQIGDLRLPVDAGLATITDHAFLMEKFV